MEERQQQKLLRHGPKFVLVPSSIAKRLFIELIVKLSDGGNHGEF